MKGFLYTNFSLICVCILLAQFVSEHTCFYIGMGGGLIINIIGLIQEEFKNKQVKEEIECK